MVRSLDEVRNSADGTSSAVVDVAVGDDTYIFTTTRRGDWELRVYPPDPYAFAKVKVGAI